MTIGLEPGNKPGIVAVGRADGTKRMDRKGESLQPRRFRVVERDDLTDVAQVRRAHQHPNGLRRAASGRIERSHDMKNTHQHSPFLWSITGARLLQGASWSDIRRLSCAWYPQVPDAGFEYPLRNSTSEFVPIPVDPFGMRSLA